MDFNIRGNKLEITDAIRNYIEEKIGRLGKYFEHPEDLMANILVKTDGILKKVEVTIPIKRAILRAEDSNKDLYAAIDLVSEKLERQIRKNKTRMNQKKYKEIDPFVDFIIQDDEKEQGNIVKKKTYDAKPMSDEEAILQMNMLDHDFFIYQSDVTNNVSVVYKRKDGNYGMIEMKS